MSSTLDHDHVVFSANVNEVEIALIPLVVRWVRNELTIYAANSDRSDWTCEWNVGNSQRGGSPIDCENVWIVLPVRAQENGNDLGVIEIACREKGPKRPIPTVIGGPAGALSQVA